MTQAQPAAAAPKLSPPRNSVAHAWLTSPEYQQLLLEADRLGQHPDRLTATIVRAVVLNGYVDAILHTP
jgi:hypothetical protein